MYGLSILCGISKVPFEIRHKIFYPYFEKWPFYTMLKIQKNSHLIARMRFWNAPPSEMLVHRMGLCNVSGILYAIKWRLNQTK